jgi:hypothetical protein
LPREQILEKDYTREGIGIAVATDDKVYITAIACAAMKEED